MGIFQDEPDEDSSPTAFQTEKEEAGVCLFQDEVEDRHPRAAASSGVPRQSRDLRVLGEEADERRGLETNLFGDEGDEEESDSSNSAYLADCENDCSKDQQQLVMQQVQLNFSTLNKFLATQLGFQQSPAEPPKKKRCYNNTRRAAIAEAKKQQKLNAGRKHQPRNSYDSCWFYLINILRLFSMGSGAWIPVNIVSNLVRVLLQDRLTALLSGRCKCREGSCFQRFKIEEVKSFLDTFEMMSKQDQDAVLFLASGSQTSNSASRREFVFLDKPLKRACFEALVGISSHRTDRIGALDMRYGKHDRASPLAASIDSFAMILYNSIAEPLPDRFFVQLGDLDSFSQTNIV